jgi:hypothetical protein
MAACERIWFRVRFAGAAIPPLYWSPEHPQGEFELVDPGAAESDLVTYAAEVAEARNVIIGRSLDDTFEYGTRGHPRRDGRWPTSWPLRLAPARRPMLLVRRILGYDISLPGAGSFL